MIRYVLQRLAAIGALAFGITLLVFLIIRLIPGDPAIVMLGTNAADPELIARLHQQLGLDRSIPEQYVVWLGRVFHGDFGYSYGQQQSVASLIGQNMPATIELTAASLALSSCSARRSASWPQPGATSSPTPAGMGIALAFMSIPSFWLGLLLILLFAVELPWFDVVGGDTLKGLVLPALTLALGNRGLQRPVHPLERGAGADAAARAHRPRQGHLSPQPGVPPPCAAQFAAAGGDRGRAAGRAIAVGRGRSWRRCSRGPASGGCWCRRSSPRTT